MGSEGALEEKELSPSDGPLSPPKYKPPPRFKQITAPPLLQASLQDNAELWLVRIQDSQLKPDEFKGKRISLALNAPDGKLGCFEDSKGSPFEILDLQNVGGVQPFAFLPKGDSSLEVKGVARQVAIVRSLDSVALSRPCSDVDQHLPSEPYGGEVIVRSSHKQKHAHKREPSRGKGDHIKAESNAVSVSISMQGLGGFSTIESLQDDDEWISTGKSGKSSKKSKRDQPSISMGIGGSSTVESLRDDEEKILTEKLGKHSKRSKRDGSSLLHSEAELSPLTPSLVHEEDTSSKKKSRKHKKSKQEQSG